MRESFDKAAEKYKGIEHEIVGKKGSKGKCFLDDVRMPYRRLSKHSRKGKITTYHVKPSCTISVIMMETL